MARSARYSCQKEKTPLTTMTARMADAQLPHALAGILRLGEERQGRGHPEDQREEMREFAQEAQPQRLAAHLLDAVGAELAQAPGRLAAGEPSVPTS